MIKTEGKTYEAVKAILKAEGLEAGDLAVATLGPGTDHLVLLDGETVGEYNHRSKKLLLYRDI